MQHLPFNGSAVYHAVTARHGLIERLSNLAPETVLGLEDVPFAIKANSLPGVLEVHDSLVEIEPTGEDSPTIDLQEAHELDAIRLAIEHEPRVIVLPRHIVVGGLIADTDAESPLESCDANGQIVHRHGRRRGNAQEERELFEAMGLNSDGNKDLDNELITARLADNAIEVLRKDRAAMTSLSATRRHQGHSGRWEDVLVHVKDLILRAGWENASDEFAEDLFGELYWTRLPKEVSDRFSDFEFALREDEAEKVWVDLVDQGLIGDPLAVMLDLYEHSGVSYSVSGEGMQCRWDTSRGAAAWIPDAGAIENITSSVMSSLGLGRVQWFGAAGSSVDPLKARYTLDDGATWSEDFKSWGDAQAALLEFQKSKLGLAFVQAMQEQARRYCKGVLEEYNSWANGEVYGVVVYVIDRETGERIEEHDDECGGHIGMPYAEDTMESAVLAKAHALSNLN